ncbi:MAG TPA: transcription elongation factor GreAB [Oceanospirillales bacterium]|nr:transcription elongation factor GreAB [Oceanospirillaceae bacterium]HBS42102.1 transcription elongation factor GreAB [Oceanospirillales bacterium]|tara:strand:+ start:2248 stop:2727 length:480 start_codon:yes stop_codon:yes gene_type:complete
MDKQTLKADLLQLLDDDIEAALASSRSAQETASHEDNQPENQYDTLALEAAYLAHGQSERILRLQKERIALAKWPMPEASEDKVIRAGALVELLSEEDEERWLLITPVGGYQLKSGGKKILVISQQTPLAKKLMNREEGEVVDLTFNGKTIGWDIVQVS